ncbi:MAG: hypothetical protein ACRDHP_01770 [Ktedonobacterales bacterium]
MSQPVWQPNYVDLCEENSIRFGAECAICGARYATSNETIARELVASAAPGSALAQEIADLKYERFAEFEGAFRELSITCYRCGRAACPDCWDDDNRMCAECVMSRGLNRSPRVGPPGRGPLQDGRLERVATGRHSDIGRPAWLNQLLEAEAARAGFVSPSRPPSLQPSVSAPHGHSALDPGSSLGLMMPFAPVDPGLLVGEPTARVATAGPARRASGDPAHQGVAGRGQNGDAHFETGEGNATSNMVSCPRCGTANYDFVTRCTVCQLQLIQICPACEKLNAGHAQQCEFCGASLERPRGWSGVQTAIKQVPPEEVHQHRMTAPPITPPPARPTPVAPAPELKRPQSKKTAPRAISTSAPALEAAAFAMPAAPALGPFESPAPSPRIAHRSGSVLDLLINGTERLASLVLLAIILVLIGGIVAAEVSPRADALIASLIHVDVRVMIANFMQQMQRLTHQNS